MTPGRAYQQRDVRRAEYRPGRGGRRAGPHRDGVACHARAGPARAATGTRLAAAGPAAGDLTLIGAKESATSAGPVVDLDYSDGLSVVSIFVQRGYLPARLRGWSKVALAGHKVYANDPDDLCFAWSARGFVYTLIAAAPQQTVGQAVAALPHDDDPG